MTKERARWAAGQIVRHGERLFINNDRGELLIVNPSPQGYREISRTRIEPNRHHRRELVNVNWSHPAYANRHIYARNDEEIIAASLAADAVTAGGRSGHRHRHFQRGDRMNDQTRCVASFWRETRAGAHVAQDSTPPQ